MTAARKRQPWLKWYPSDWRAEPRLKMVSRAARSLWVDMLGLMHEADPCGFLIVGSTPLTTAELIARALGDSEPEIAELLAELEMEGIFSRVGDDNLSADIAELVPESIPAGTILSRKMVRDTAKAEKGHVNGALGGNPILTQSGGGGLTPGLSPGLREGVKTQRPEYVTS